MTMTRQEAIEYNNVLKKELKQAALQYDLEESFGIYIVDHCITVLPEDARKGMIFLGKDAVSYKVGNVKLDLKNALIAGLELVASVNMPESIFNYIQLLIVSAFFIEKVMKHNLSKLEAYIVYWLHMKNAYNAGIEEEKFVCELQEWYQGKEGRKLSREDVTDTISRLCDIKIVDFENGNIYLKEKVWGKVE